MKQHIEPDILFRVSTDPKYGLGHVVRMIALRNVFDKPVYWFVDKGTIKTIKSLIHVNDVVQEEHSNFASDELLRKAHNLPSALIICDSYQITPSAFRNTQAPVVFFCDEDIEALYDKVLLVNCQPAAKLRKGCLSGPRFMPIETFGKKRTSIDFSKISYPINCLIGFGSVDSENHTCLALEAIFSDKMLREAIRPVCLLGRYFKNEKLIRKFLDKFNEKELIEGCDTVSRHIKRCDVAIGAAGFSHAERLYLGLPTVLVSQNERHQKICLNWQNEGCALYANSEPADIARRLKELIADEFEIAKSISIHGQRLIDGKGASRIISRLPSDWLKA